MHNSVLSHVHHDLAHLDDEFAGLLGHEGVVGVDAVPEGVGPALANDDEALVGHDVFEDLGRVFGHKLVDIELFVDDRHERGLG